MKKLLAVLLCLLLALGMSTATSESLFSDYAVNDDYFIRYYQNNTYGLIEIDGFGSPLDWRQWTADMVNREISLEIPASIDGLPVGVITLFFSFNARAYNFPGRVVSITIPDSVMHIMDGALAFPGLREIIISPDHPVFEVVDGVLFDKTTNKLVCYPAGLEAESYTIPDGTLTIASSAFACCSLKSLTLPDSVTTMYSDSLEDCSQLETLHIGSGLTPLAKPQSGSVPAPFAFSWPLREINVSAANTAYRSVDGLLYSADGTTLLCCPAGRAGSICLPEGVTAINPYAFENCWNPLAITLPESLFENGEPLSLPLYPIAITDERMQQFLNAEGLSRKAQRTIQDYYKFIEPGTRDAQKLIASFPALADTPLWIERRSISGSTLNASSQAKLASNLAEAGYTPDDLLIDDALLASGPRSLYPYTVVCKVELSVDILPEGSTLVAAPDSLAYHWAKQNGFPVRLSE